MKSGLLFFGLPNLQDFRLRESAEASAEELGPDGGIYASLRQAG